MYINIIHFYLTCKLYCVLYNYTYNTKGIKMYTVLKMYKRQGLLLKAKGQMEAFKQTLAHRKILIDRYLDVRANRSTGEILVD